MRTVMITIPTISERQFWRTKNSSFWPMLNKSEIMNKVDIQETVSDMDCRDDILVTRIIECIREDDKINTCC